MVQSIFNEWFINFNFPNEDGKPYSKSGGEMIGSEFGKIPKRRILLYERLSFCDYKKIFEYYLKKINKNADNEAIEETIKKVINLESLDFI